jgi:pyruvate,water dikinase
MSLQYGQEATDVAVRSSATAEDLPDASFAGQQETFLNIRGHQDLISAVRNCFASLFTDRAIVYRESLGYDHFQVGSAWASRKWCAPTWAAAAWPSRLDTESGFKDVVLINGSYGLGEMVVQGAVSPDEFLVFKPTLAEGFSSIIEKKLGNKDRKMVYGVEPGKPTSTIPIERAQRHRFCISDDQALGDRAQCGGHREVLQRQERPLVPHGCGMGRGRIDQAALHRASAAGDHPQPQGHGPCGGIQDPQPCRFEARRSKEEAPGDHHGHRHRRPHRQWQGAHPLQPRWSRGGDTDGKDFQQGDVLVTDMTDPDWEPIMKKASAIITNKGGRTCHAAIVAREMGVPAIVGCGNATDLLDTGMEVTASCCEGDTGIIYSGIIPFHKEETMLADMPETKTPIMLNVASTDLAFKFAHLPNAGVGLAREEFIINNYIQAHPLALLQHKELGDHTLSGKISYLINGYEDEETFFVKRLSYGIAKIAAPSTPTR